MNWEVTKQVAAAFIRWAIAFVGAWLVKRGIIDQPTADAWLSELTTAILGFAILAIPVIWKWLNARYNQIALERAVQHEPTADTAKEIKAAVAEVKVEVHENNTAVASY